MINAGELYYLNRALDGSSIYGINLIESLISNQENGGSPRESLIKKHILEDNEDLNEKSFNIIRNLENYKKAEKHILLNDIVVSIDDTKYVTFLKKHKKEQFTFERLTKSYMVYTIIAAYPFLGEDIPTDDKTEIIEPDDLILNEISMKDSKDVLYVQKEKNKEFDICNIYYKEDYVYKYDLLKRELRKISPRDIRLELMKIFEIEVN